MQEISQTAPPAVPSVGLLLVGRRVDADQLVGATDIAVRLSLARSQDVHHLRRRDPTFPEPVTVLGGGPHWGIYVWAWPDIARWAQAKGYELAEGEWRRPPRAKSVRERLAEFEALERELGELGDLRSQLDELAALRERVERRGDKTTGAEE